MKIVDELENYLLISDGVRFTVVERRAGRLYGLRNRARHGVAPDDVGVTQLMKEAGSLTEPQARHLLADVATRWRDLFEHVR